MLAPDRRSLAVMLAGLAIAVLAVPAYAIPPAAVANIEVTAPPNPTHIPLKVGDFATAIALGLTVGPGATAGELTGSAEATGHDPKLSQSMAGQNLRIGDELAEAMAAALKAKGFNAYAGAQQQQQQPTAKIAFIIEEAGYERRVWGKIGPKLTVRVRLFDAASNDRLWSDTYKYDLAAMTIGWTMLRPPEQYGFEEPEDVLAHPELAVEGLRTGIRMIAERAADDLIGEIDK